MTGAEFAPEYSKREKLRLLLMHIAWAFPLFIVTQHFFLPWFSLYIQQAHCYHYAGWAGNELVFYGLFVGLPVSLVVILLLIEGPRTMRILLSPNRSAQNPLPNEKVFKPTRYTYGAKAKIKPTILLMLLMLLLAMSIRGIFWAQDIIAMTSTDTKSTCSQPM